MAKKKPTEVERSAIVLNYSEAFYNLTQDGQAAPADVTMLLLHRLRASLRDGECPDCPDCALRAALEASTTPEHP